MKALVKYIDHHYDNYQGGSGTSFEFSTIVDLDKDLRVYEVAQFIQDSIFKLCKTHRPYSQKDSYPVIKEVSIYE
jgi:bacillopeptidase F (M6 metalloprotease family)